MKTDIIKNQEFKIADANESSSGAFEAFRGGAVPPSATKIYADPICKNSLC